MRKWINLTSSRSSIAMPARIPAAKPPAYPRMLHGLSRFCNTVPSASTKISAKKSNECAQSAPSLHQQHQAQCVQSGGDHTRLENEQRAGHNRQVWQHDFSPMFGQQYNRRRLYAPGAQRCLSKAHRHVIIRPFESTSAAALQLTPLFS